MKLFTNLWKKLGPPQDRTKRRKYFIGYFLYLIGIAILFFNWYSGLDQVRPRFVGVKLSMEDIQKA